MIGIKKLNTKVQSNTNIKKGNPSTSYVTNYIEHETLNIDISISDRLSVLNAEKKDLEKRLENINTTNKNGVNPEFLDLQSKLRDVNKEIGRLTLENEKQELENEIEYLKSLTGYDMELLAAQERLEVVDNKLKDISLRDEIDSLYDEKTELELTIEDLKDRPGYEMELYDAQNRLEEINVRIEQINLEYRIKDLETEIINLSSDSSISKEELDRLIAYYNNLKNLKSKQDEMLPYDCELFSLLSCNPNLEYVGVEKHNTNYGAEINAYKVYDSKNDITYYIQQDFNAEYDISSVFSTVSKMSEESSTLANANKGNVIVLTSISCPNNDKRSEQYGRDFVAAASCNSESGEIAFWKECDDSNVYGTLCHETGHSVDRNYQYSNSDQYADAVAKDGNFVSDYAEDSYYTLENKYCEDFADSIKYIAINGPEKFKENFPNRAEYFIKLVPEMFE